MWRIDFDPDQQLLSIWLKGTVSPLQMREVAEANAKALECTGGGPFKLFLDLRELFPLESEAVTLLGDIKKIAVGVPGCGGLAIVADSPTVAMQQQRTRIREGSVSEHELITLDFDEAKRFLKA